MSSPLLEKQSRNVLDTPSEKDRTTEIQWLQWLHEMLPDVTQLLLFDVKPNHSIELCGQSQTGDVVAESVINAVLSSTHRKRPLYVPNADTENQYLLVIPFQANTADKRLTKKPYVLVMLCSALSTIQQKTAIKLSVWASAKFNVPTHASPSEKTPDLSPRTLLSHALVEAQQQHGSFTAIAFSLVNTMVGLCGCQRVSLGYYEDGKLKLSAVSGQSKVNDRRKIARQLCAIMLDTIEHKRVLFPDTDESVEPAFQAYYRSQGEHPILAFVIPSAQPEKFVLVLERERGNVFVPAQADAIERTVQSVSGILALSRDKDRSLLQKSKRAFKHHVEQVKSVSDWSTKRWLATVACVALLFSFVIPVKHRISADAFIEASDRQVLVAAQDGFILSAHARAGEEVSKGDLLAKIDSQDLQLNLDKWHSEITKNHQEYAQALATHDRTELSRLKADETRIEAEIALLEKQLSRSEVRAPFNGVLLDGDWTQSLGAPIKTGDTLFEVASAEQYRLVLQVDEHDIGYIEPEQLAELRMAALPTTVWQAELGDIMPVAVSEKGSSAFRVAANITGEASALRPGMEGVAKVTIGRRSMFWVYTYRLLNKLRYVGWRVGLL